MSHAKLKALAFLVAIPLGFALAVWLGREAATYAKPDKFVRFHQGIAPESLFYPPFSTLENLALARWSPGRTLVIIGGNSILNGVGQSDKNLWSRRLQEELGERYVVVNLSFRGALPCEAGALVAESLIKRGLPVVLISNTAPGTVGRVAGGAYGYLYYNGLAHNRLMYHPAREADLAAWEETATPSIREQQTELRRAAALDAALRRAQAALARGDETALLALAHDAGRLGAKSAGASATPPASLARLLDGSSSGGGAVEVDAAAAEAAWVQLLAQLEALEAAWGGAAAALAATLRAGADVGRRGEERRLRDKDALITTLQRERLTYEVMLEQLRKQMQARAQPPPPPPPA